MCIRDSDNSGKDFLMHHNWPTGEVKIDQSQKDVEKIIDIISELRSFKNELNVSPGSFTTVSISNLSKETKKFVKDNSTVLKKLGRVNDFLEDDQNKSSGSMVISGEIYKVYFDENVNLTLIKENLVKKQSKLKEEADKISKRLSNKGFVDRAPKDIVEQEKSNYNNLENDIKKLSLTIESL